MKKLLFVLMALFVAMPVAAGVVTIDFNTNPTPVALGEQISTQYSAYGVVFLPGTFGDIPTVAQDSLWSGVNVLSTAGGLGLGAGDFTIHFTSPVTDVSFDSGLWDSGVIFDTEGLQTGFGLGVVTVTDSIGGIHIYNNLNIYDLNDPNFSEFYTFAFPDLVGMSITDISFDSSSDPGGASITNLSFTTPVPEPGTMILLGSGLMGLASYGRKRRKK